MGQKNIALFHIDVEIEEIRGENFDKIHSRYGSSNVHGPHRQAALFGCFERCNDWYATDSEIMECLR